MDNFNNVSINFSWISLDVNHSSGPVAPSSEWTCGMFAFVLNTAIIGPICLLGLAGNILSILVLRRDRHNDVAAFLLQSLAVADSSLLIVSFVVLTVFVGIGTVLRSSPDAGLMRAVPYLKKYVNPFGYIATSFTIWTTVLLAVNRFLVVYKPFSFDRQLTLTRARLQVVAVVGFSIALNIPRFFQYDVVHHPTTGNQTVPRTVATTLGKNQWVEVIYFNGIYTSLVLIAPLFLMVAADSMLLRRLFLSKQNMVRNSSNGSYIGFQERNITTVMVIIILQMLIFHTPDRVVTVLKYLSDRSATGLGRDCPDKLYYVASFSNFLIVVNSSTNFLIYYCFRERFRRILRYKVCFPEVIRRCSGDRRELYETEFFRRHSDSMTESVNRQRLISRRTSATSNGKRFLETIA